MRSYVIEKRYLYRINNTTSMIRFTRNILLATLCLLCSITLAQAQISFGGVPAITAQSHRVVEIIPSFNAQDLRSAEQWHQVDNGSPLIVGRMLPLSGDFYQHAPLRGRTRRPHHRHLLVGCRQLPSTGDACGRHDDAPPHRQAIDSHSNSKIK